MYNRKVHERYLTEAEEKQLMNHVKKFSADVYAERDYYWMVLLRQTGIRVSRLVALTVSDTRDALAHRRFIVKGLKGGADYSVNVNKKAATAIRHLLRIRRAMGANNIPDAPLIMSRNHKGLSVRSVQDRMLKWVLSAGLGVDASPHWMRHTLGKRIVKNSTAAEPLLVAQRVLGQSNINSTTVYTMPDREDIELAMEEAS